MAAAPDMGAQQPNNATEQFYFTPPSWTNKVNHEKLPFYGPKSFGHQLTPDAAYAVRCNEAYKDAKAALEGERGHVRNAAIRAETIFFHRANGQKPILIMMNFSPNVIATRGAQFAVSDAATRAETLVADRYQELKVNRTEGQQAEHIQYRLVGPTSVIKKLATQSQPSHFFTCRNHHIDGAMVAHCYLKEHEVTRLSTKMCVERLANIHTSNSYTHQFTMRHKEADAAKLFEVALALQANGCLTTIRTWGTLRVTAANSLEPAHVAALRKQYPDFKIYLDTPVNAWASGHDEIAGTHKKKHVSTPEFTAAKQSGQKLARISADYYPHPSDFKAVAEALGASVVETCTAVYTDAPMSAIICFPADLDVTALLQQPPFTISEEGSWTLHFLRFKV